MTVLRRMTAHLGLVDQAEDRYPRLPFEVPAGVESIGVTMDVAEPDPDRKSNV